MARPRGARVAAVALTIAVSGAAAPAAAAGVSGSGGGGAGGGGAGLPPSERATLARLFDPQLAPLGLRTTRAALQDPDGYERSSTGTHLAIYVEPTTEGLVDRATYVRNIMKVARVFLPYVYRRWPGLKTFDVCQEPEPALDPRPVPVPLTQLIATRKGAAALRWKHATLATLIRRANAIEARRGAIDPLSLYVGPDVLAQPEFQAALARAHLPRPTPASTPAE